MSAIPFTEVGKAVGSTAAAGIDTIGNIYTMIQGYKQLREAKKLKEGLVRPVYEPDQNILDNQEIQRSIASEGFAADERQAYYDQANRLFSSSIGAVKDFGGGSTGLNVISDLYKSQLTGFGAILAADAAQHTKNFESLMTANKDVAAENLMAFDYNKNMPYQETVNTINDLKKSGNENMVNALHQQADNVNTMFGNTPYTSDKGLT